MFEMRALKYAVWALAAVLTLGHGTAMGDPGDLLQTFANPHLTGGDNFGVSVAGMGSNVLVGANSADIGAVSAGVAYLFDGSTGTLLRTFNNPTPAAHDEFGASVAGVGNKVVVGAHCDNTGAIGAGAAYLFNSSTGALLHTLQKPTPTDYDYFGFSAAAVGSNFVVGALYANEGATNAGAAYLFDGATGALLRTFQSPTPADNDRFGWCVAAVGGNVLVGAPLDDTDGYNAGAAYLFDGSTGALLQTFHNPTAADDDEFGCAVAAVEDNVLIGAYQDDTAAPNGGAAYLFDGVTGALLRTFLSPSPDNGDLFGQSVAGVGGDVAVGAPYDGGGTAFVFDGSTGAMIAPLVNPTPEWGDKFGHSLAAVGSNVLVGAVCADNGGAAYLFVPEPATLLLLAAGGLLLRRRRRRA